MKTYGIIFMSLAMGGGSLFAGHDEPKSELDYERARSEWKRAEIKAAHY